MDENKGDLFCGVTCPGHLEFKDVGFIIVAHKYRPRVESRAKQVGGIRNFWAQPTFKQASVKVGCIL